MQLSGWGILFTKHLNRTVIVAMIPVRVVQVARHKIVDVTGVGHRLMATARTVDVRCAVATAAMFRCAARRIRGARWNLAHLFRRLTGYLQLAMLQVGHFPAGGYRHVAASWAVAMLEF